MTEQKKKAAMLPPESKARLPAHDLEDGLAIYSENTVSSVYFRLTSAPKSEAANQGV
jgi:hypothetical protein